VYVVRLFSADPVTGIAGERAEVQAWITAERSGVEDTEGVVGWLQRLCRAAVRALPASGVGVSVLSESGGQVTVAASDATSEAIEELQFIVGEGPCLDAFASRRPVLTSNLAGEAMTRWPGYSPTAHDRGVRAVFAFPLQMGAARLGALDVYRDRPGALSTRALHLSLTFAEVAMTALLDAQEDRGGADHPISGGLGELLDDTLDDTLDDRAELWQAQGMVMMQLGVSMPEAMARLRAHAYATDCRLIDVAGDIVARKLRLERDPP
jgi:hypothetical protein